MIRRFVKACLFASLLFASYVSLVQAAEPVDTVQGIIEDQIAAFLNDDAETAYSFASPMIKEKFRDKGIFFEMVKRGYQPVYRPGNFKFGRNKLDGNTVVQEVVIVGPDGSDWTALYYVVKQPDGSYKINGVQMLQQKPGPEI
ncbi:DUF4864 domain-containing protein [Pararhizobium sp.]|uniref:DUF4864 domain-containing protein n=1 Tax=Pararhizobium sp. TaxID=1977563 RepID=UPI002716E997|nr:DUF4864 domain-containing protein [Pararhizobium sp.]MDO9418562.1 DUF4864 domain-containing protein [Pararhizobium sp.]